MSHGDRDDPRCPACGEPIGLTAAYCVCCSADLTMQEERTDATDEGGLLAPDGLVDNALTAVVGLAGGLVVGLIATTVLLLLTGSSWGVWIGLVAWLAATAHLVRRRTVRDAVARPAYAVSLVLLLVPFAAFGPSSEATDLGTRAVVFAAMLAGVTVPAAVAAGFGFAVSRFRLGSGAE